MTIRDLQHNLRQLPMLAPDDSVARTVRLLRAKGAPALLVAHGAGLIGIINETDLLAFASASPGALRAARVGELMRPIPLVAPLESDLGALAQQVSEAKTSLVPVIAPDGRVLGVLLVRDLLAALAGEPVMPSVGGMATPTGVFLMAGNVRAGASDLALAGTGAGLMALNLLAIGAITALTWLLERVGLITLVSGRPEEYGAVGIAAAALAYGLEMAMFLLLLRLSPLSGTHAAEHMVVHAIEEGEDLTLEKVKQLPRVHPRCGTNLIAMLVLVVAGEQFITSLHGVLDPDSQMMAQAGLLLLVLLTWRRLGAALQHWITTKRPSDRQVENAIHVAEQLIERVHTNRQGRANLFRRIWQRGFIQVLAGFGVVAAAAQYGFPYIMDVWRIITG